MLLLNRCRLALAEDTKYKYIFMNVVHNSIGDDGASQLCKAKWPLLQELKLRNLPQIEKTQIF